MPVRLVVVGATGYIGARIVEVATARMPTLGTSSRGGDLLRLDLLRADEFDYARLGTDDIIALTAGISAPDACASDRSRAWALNVEGTSAFMENALQTGARLIFLSSDTVYGERDGAFDESADCRPAGDYAEMKSAVEERFASHPRVKSLRLSYVFSAEDKFTRYLRDCAARGESAEIFHPFYRAVVHREEVVEAILALARRWNAVDGFAINVGGPEILSRIDCASLLKEGALPRLKFTAVEPEAQFFHNRPRVIRMASPRLAQLLGRLPCTMRDAVRKEFGTA